ncbi:hypothetical protein N0V90_002108 [Kalmusia sp. IMI 367209]|nr:hypothetical protein N0V90_002108 [Kalmusia sp. IMI 367209]
MDSFQDHSSKETMSQDETARTKLNEHEDFMWSDRILDNSIWIKKPQTDDESIKTHDYASFGDEDGTTVSVNAYGHIMQISRYLGFGVSGFFCVSDDGVNQPYYVWSRMQDLMEITHSPERGIGVGLDEILNLDHQVPTLGFMYDRWPRFVHGEQLDTRSDSGSQHSGLIPQSGTSRTRTPKFMIQYYCENGTVFQQYLIQLDDLTLGILDNLKILNRTCIDNLDFIKYYEHHGYDDDVDPGGKEYVVKRDVTKEEKASHPNQEEANSFEYIALSIKAFVGEKFQSILEDGTIRLDTEEKEDAIAKKRLKITIAYRLHLLSGAESKTQRNEELKPSTNISSATKYMTLSLILLFAAIWSIYFLFAASQYGINLYLKQQNQSLGQPRKKDKNSQSQLHVEIYRVTVSVQEPAFQFLRSMLDYIYQRQKNFGLEKGLPLERNVKRGAADNAPKQHRGADSEQLEEQKEYLMKLRRRIERVLQGHILWVCTKAGTLENETFSPHHYPSGRIVSEWDYLEHPSFIDTPLQLLKIQWANGFSTVQETLSAFEGVENFKALWPKIGKWILRLEISNPRGNFAFPAISNDDSTKEYYQHEDYWENSFANVKYRLTDHVMICEALRYIKERHDQVKESISDREILLRRHTDRISTHTGKKSRHVEEVWAQFRDELDEEKRRLEEDKIVTEDFDWFQIFLTQYNFDEVRKKTLKRFTVENPISKGRMLATRRTSNDTRFLLHSKDSFLFHATKIEFFSQNMTNPEKKGESSTYPWKYADDFWKSTAEIQGLYDLYQAPQWDKPLWYVLVIILGCHGISVKNASVEGQVRAAKGILIKNTSKSGLFPGYFNEAAPAIYEDEFDRDDYWHSTFEIPNVLWTYVRGELPDSSRESHQMTHGDISGKLSDATMIGKQHHKEVPFDNLKNLVDQRRLMVVTDDWLQDLPVALDFTEKPDFVLSGCINQPDNGTPEEICLGPAEDEHWKGAIENFKSKNRSHNHRLDLAPVETEHTQTDFQDDQETKGVVIDIGRNSEGDEIFTANPQKNQGILKSLAKRRTVWQSKKRIIWLSNGDRQTSLLCYLSTPPLERERTFAFFDRHASHEKYFFDATNAALNEWETELHLSFFQLFRSTFLRSREIQLDSCIANPGYITMRSKNTPVSSTALSQVAMSFRFVGDYFDRYWTCHFLEPLSETNQTNTLGKRLEGLKHSKEYQQWDISQKRRNDTGNQRKHPRHWQQRKVLELLLVYEMLKTLEDSTLKIYKWVRFQQRNETPFLEEDEYVEDEEGSRSKFFGNAETFSDERFFVEASEVIPANDINSLGARIRIGMQLLRRGTADNYSELVGNWGLLEQILMAIEDNLLENMEIIDQWTRREEDRKSEKPRWTLRDERNHHTTITRLTILNQRKIRDISHLRSQIQAFRESLPKRLESIREDINFLGSQNINLFTYVTVVFLPLGFATGVFSTSGPPASYTLKSLSVTAIVALSLTIFALSNAKTGKTIIRPAVQVSRWICLLVLLPICRQSVFSGLVLWKSITYVLFQTCIGPLIRAFWLITKLQQQKREKKAKQPESTPSTFEKIMGFSIKEAVKSEVQRTKHPEIPQGNGVV